MQHSPRPLLNMHPLNKTTQQIATSANKYILCDKNSFSYPLLQVKNRVCQNILYHNSTLSLNFGNFFTFDTLKRSYGCHKSWLPTVKIYCQILPPFFCKLYLLFYCRPQTHLNPMQNQCLKTDLLNTETIKLTFLNTTLLDLYDVKQ